MNKKGFLIFTAILLVTTLSFSVLGASSYSGSLSVTNTGGTIVISGPGGAPSAYCGDNIFQILNGEQCDNQDLGSQTCESLGYDSGTLSCKGDCTYDTLLCVVCGDGIIAGSEQCDDGNLNSGDGCSSSCTTESSSSSSSSSSGGSSGGGGSSYSPTSSCIENWQCSEWSTCKNSLQTRDCDDENECDSDLLKPSEERSCTVEGESGEAGIGLNTEEQSFMSKITGAVIGGGATSVISLVFIALVIVGAIIVYIKKK